MRVNWEEKKNEVHNMNKREKQSDMVNKKTHREREQGEEELKRRC